MLELLPPLEQSPLLDDVWSVQLDEPNFSSQKRGRKSRRNRGKIVENRISEMKEAENV